MSNDEKTAEQLLDELRKSWTILQASINCLPFDFFALGPDGRCILQNDISREHWGPTIGKLPQEICSDPRTLDVWLSNNRRAFAGERFDEEVTLFRNGEELAIRNVIAPIRDGSEMHGILGISVDITAQKRAEEAMREAREELERRVQARTRELTETNAQLRREIESRKETEAALRQSRDELQAIYDGMPDGIHIVDVERVKLVRVNPALCRMLGYTEAETLQLSLADVHPPESLPWIRERFRAHAKGHTSRTEELPLVRKDGSMFYADVTGRPVVYEDRPCMMCFFHDITERKRAHEAIQREHRTLKHLLQSSDHERQLIAYEIHDELAQQLAGAIMQFQTFEHSKDRQPKEAAGAYQAGMTMLRQAHFETRRLIAGVRPPILDESGVVAAVGHLVNEQSRLNGPRIEYRSQVDFDRLAPILENSIYRIGQEGLANACRHSGSEKVRISLIQQGDVVRIVIRDWGVGFDPKNVQRGCYGLAGIRQRARLLGGKCRIRSYPGKGTCVAVELPVVERD